MKVRFKYIRNPLVVVVATLLVWATVGRFCGDKLRSETVDILTKFPRIWEEATETASVIYRIPKQWNSCLWINKGLGEVECNAVVLKKGAVIGVVDYVGKHQARVALITDGRLKPAVRVVRGDLSVKNLAEDLDRLLQDLSFYDPQSSWIEKVIEMRNEITLPEESWYLAKGQLEGLGAPLSSSKGSQLKGTGFNLDFEDERSDARDLRTGESAIDKVPLIRKGDLLVTSGLDGLFPEGLPIAHVTDVFPLKEGDFYYDLVAVPVAGDLLDIEEVDLIPALGFNPADVPPPLWRKFS